MSGSESPAPTFLRAPPPPPRIRPESPANDVVEISDAEDGSDISSVSDFNDEVDKLEAVSDNELMDDSWTEDRQKEVDRPVDESEENSKTSNIENSKTSVAAIVDLEDIESDEDLPDVDSKNKEPENDLDDDDVNDDEDKPTSQNGSADVNTNDVSFCRQCKLSFVDAEAAKNHEKTEPHRLLLSGFKPSHGSHHCLVCWSGHKTSEDLETHLKTEEHKLETEKHRILQMNFSPPPLPENTSSRKRPLKSGSGEPQSKLPRTYPPPLDGFYGKEDPETGILLRPEDLEDVCSTCNLLFLSKKHLKAHLKSRNHLLESEGRSPSFISRYFCEEQTRNFHCVVCWIGFTRIRKLLKHYEHPMHAIKMKQYGVLRLLESVQPSGDDEQNDAKNISLKDYIVLDEVGACDDGDVEHGTKSPKFNEIVADQLDNVSSDDEVNNVLSDGEINNVSSGDDEFTKVSSNDEVDRVQPSEDVDSVQPLEDVDSSDDEVNNVTKNEANHHLEPLSEDEAHNDITKTEANHHLEPLSEDDLQNDDSQNVFNLNDVELNFEEVLSQVESASVIGGEADSEIEEKSEIPKNNSDSFLDTETLPDAESFPDICNENLFKEELDYEENT